MMAGFDESFTVKTGEEDEEIVFEARSKAYFFFKEDTYGMETRTNMWKERGLGNVKILRGKKKPSSFRVLLRQEKTLKPKVNFSIVPDHKIAYMTGTKKAIIVHATDFSDEKAEERDISFKFKDETICEGFVKAFKTATDAHSSAATPPSAPNDDGATKTSLASIPKECFGVGDAEVWADLRKVISRPSAWTNGTSHLRHPNGSRENDGTAKDNAYYRVDASDGNVYHKSSFVEYYGENSKEWNSATPAGMHELATKKVLVIGAGGLGCELLKNLVLSGVKNIHVIDADTIDITNLNRQFLFRLKDVGNGKAQTAAKFVKRIVPDVNITMDTCFIQDVANPDEFYSQFDIVICGLDNLKARQWMSARVHSDVSFKPNARDGSTKMDPRSVAPMIDGGTEGLMGQTHVIIPYRNADFSVRQAEQFAPRQGVASCTIASNPRKPEHCVIFAKKVLWHQMAKEKVAKGEWKKARDPDTDSRTDMEWIMRAAQEHAKKHNFGGIDYNFTMGVVKNIIPAVPCSNAMSAASCTVEAVKLLTLCGRSMNNNMMVKGDNYSNVSNTWSGSHNEWCRSLHLQSVVVVPSKDTTVEEFVSKTLANHKPTHELLARYNIAYLLNQDDDAEDAREDGNEPVTCVRTEIGSMQFRFESEIVTLKAPKKQSDGAYIAGDIMEAVYAGLDDDDARRECGRMCLVRVDDWDEADLSQGWQDVKINVYLDDDEVVATQWPLPENQRLVCVPRLTVYDETFGGVKSLECEAPSTNCVIVAEKGKTTTMKDFFENDLDGSFKEVSLTDFRLNSGRITLFLCFPDSTFAKALAQNTSSGASKSDE